MYLILNEISLSLIDGQDPFISLLASLGKYFQGVSVGLRGIHDAQSILLLLRICEGLDGYLRDIAISDQR